MGFNYGRITGIRISLIVFFITLFAVYLYAAKLYVPSLIRNQITGLERDKGITVDVKNIRPDLISGLTLNEVKIGNVSDPGAGPVSVNKVSIRPNYIKSVTERKLVAESIRIEGPRLIVGEGFFDLIKRVGADVAGSEENGTDGTSRADIRRLDISDLSLVLSDEITVDMKELKIGFHPEGSKKKFVLSGYFERNGNEGGLRFLSEVLIKEDKKLGLYINFPELKKGNYSSDFKLPEDLSLTISTEISYGNRILSTGEAGIKGSESGDMGNILWDARYAGPDSKLEFGFLRGEIKDLARLDIRGSTGKLSGGRIAELRGEINLPDISSLGDWITVLERFNLQGSVTANGLNIYRSDVALGLNTGLSVSNFVAEFGEGEELRLSELKSTGDVDFLISREDKSKTYTLTGNGFAVRGFSYLGFETGVCDIESFSFNYYPDQWDMSLNARGPAIINGSLEAGLSDFILQLDVDKKNHIEVSGRVEGTSGKYYTFGLDGPKSSFHFRPGTLTFTDLQTDVENYGAFRIERGVLLFPSEITPGYEVEIFSGGYRYFGHPIYSDNFKALFAIKNDGEANQMIEGKVISEAGSVYGKGFSDLSFEFSSYLDEYKISNISATFLEGKLSGNLNFKRNDGKLAFKTSMELNDSGFAGGDFQLNSKSVRFNSEGSYSDGLLYETSGNVDIKGLSVGKDSDRIFDTSFKISAGPETITIKEGFISNKAGGKFGFTGYLEDYGGRNSLLNFTAPDIPLDFIIGLFSDYLPDNTFIVDVEGSLMIDFKADSIDGNYDKWSGKFKINRSTVSAFISDTEFLIENLEGAVTIKDESDIDHKLSELLGTDLTLNRDVYKSYLNVFQEKSQIETRDFIRIGKIKYGFFEAENITGNFEMDKEKMNLLFLRSDVYGGHIFANGLLKYGSESEKEKYDINMLFLDLSLEKITDSLPSMKGYITGLVDGLLWFTVGNSYTTINGPFAFWARDSEFEKRTIGRALLDKIGAKGRFFTGSSRKYNKGEIAGYIKDGIITFKKFIISNKILGYTDLKIQADKKMNSISVKHLLSVIRELARRASKGDIEIEYQ